MTQPSNKISNFWQELKRRKVVRVITVYAAAAFVILELVSIIVEPLKLPEWLLPVVIVLLCVGFIIAVILSWIYDVHPEGGIVKTEPAIKVKEEEKHPSSKGWRIASYIGIVVIVALIVLNVIPRTNRSEVKEILDKSIAVLPLMNLSSNEDISSIGYTDEIIMELQKIKAFDRVLSLSSTMQFAEQRPIIPEIGMILNVNYLVEGTIQKQHDRISVNIQVIIAKEDDHIWGKEFEDAWENRFNLQDEIAFEVAKELQIILSPSEKEHIEKIPTTSVTARDLYQRGRAEHEKFWLSGYTDIEALERAENLYYLALDYDSTFALAYIGLARVFWNVHYTEYLTENYLDSVLILADIALSFDDQLAEAYIIRGQYFQSHNQKDQAINELDKAIKFNPNIWVAYWAKGNLYFLYDNVKAIDNLHKATSLHRGSFLPWIYRQLSYAYLNAGFNKVSYNYVEEALKLDNDSVEYYFALLQIEHGISNYENTIEFGERLCLIGDSTHNYYQWTLFLLGYSHMVLGQVEESLEYLKKSEKLLKSRDRTDALPFSWLGYAYWVNGFKEEAKHYLNAGIERYNKILELHQYRQSREIDTYYNLAASYAAMGDKDKAYENLRHISQFERMSLWVNGNIKDDPMFDSIKNESEFQQIVRDIEAKYQAEHERVRQWLEKNEML